ncbi:MAG: hypothetical protein ACK2U3_01095 [Anaerolineales bacterium]|jgi:hypothetical protein
MSKKTRKRQTRRSRSTSRSEGAAVSREAKTRKNESEFNPDYSDTIKDLKRIGILAGTFFVVLLGLSVYFNYLNPLF